MSILDERAAKWYERIQSCFEKYKKDEKANGKTQRVTQSELVRRMEEKYPDEDFGLHLTQVNISRWFNFGSTGKWRSGPPPLKVVVLLADFFGVDVGYLLGETDCSTFQKSDAVGFLGLNEEAIDRIRLATRYETAFRNVHMLLPDEAGETISKLLASEGFFDLVMALEELEKVYAGPNIQKKLFKELEEKYGNEMLTMALDFDSYDHENEEIDPVLIEAHVAVEEALDKMDTAESAKREYAEASRYKLIKTFEKIIEELYPQ